MDIDYPIASTLGRVKKRKMDRPYIVGVCTISLNGKLNSRKNESSYSFLEYIPDGYYDQIFFPLRKNCQAIMVGTETVVIDNPSLTSGTNPNKSPIRIIPDRKGRIPLNHKIFNGKAKTILFVNERTPREYLEKLKSKKNLKIIELKENNGIPTRKMIEKINNEGISFLLLEGGGKLINSFMKAGLLDEIWLQVLPIVFPNGVSLFQTDFSYNLRLSKIFRIKDSIICNYLIGKNQ